MKLNNEHRRELVRGLASAASLCGLLLGVPILLILGVGWPLPQGTPSGSEALTALKTGAIPPSLILKPISLVIWVLWLQMLAGVGIELWAHFHGRVAPRVSFIPLFMQRLSARLMGTVLVVALSMQHPGTALADNKDLLAPPTLELHIAESWSVESNDESAPANPDTTTGEVLIIESPDPLPLLHTVERHDSLRMLAERYLGDPNRWTEVFVLNQGQTQADGGSLTDPARLRPGWQLVMPADAHLPTPPKLTVNETPDGGRQPEDSVIELDDLLVTVQEGDTLWGLAADHLDDPERWVEIFDSNQDIIQDPDVILPGWQLEIPMHAGKSTAVGPSTDPLLELVDHAAFEIPSPFGGKRTGRFRNPSPFGGKRTGPTSRGIHNRQAHRGGHRSFFQHRTTACSQQTNDARGGGSRSIHQQSRLVAGPASQDPASPIAKWSNTDASFPGRCSCGPAIAGCC